MTPIAGGGANNARLIAELQAVAIGIRLVGLRRLPEVMRPTPRARGENHG